ncbi:hypothetical protein JCM8097_005619 [Rhodosporidiobolus ruineniae]
MASPLAVAAAAAGCTTIAAYLDAKLDLSYDWKLIRGVIGTRLQLARGQKQDKNSLWYTFEATAKKRGAADCYVCDGVALSWNEVYDQATQLAHWLLEQGLERGDTVALYMPNKPAYPIVYLACLAIDVLPACLNYNLTGPSLAHCIKVAAPKLVLFDSDYSSPIASLSSQLRAELPKEPRFVRWVDRFCATGTGEKEKREGEEVEGETVLTEEIRARQGKERIPDERRSGIQWTSPACLIYTSGTTGLPKAALTLHGRCVSAFRVWSSLNSFGPKSRIYTPMPLYHSTALVLAVGAAWHSGATIVIGRKFSARTFWDDVRASRANVIQYVGEVLRYLLAQPPSPLDKQHDVKLAYGNGCRPDVWEKFRERFGVQAISEFFASSEGNGSLFNLNHNSFAAGAVGRQGALLGLIQRSKMVVVRVDPLTEDPARGADGLCVRAETDEPGELVMKIAEESGYEAFAGYYNNKAATEKKIIRDVLQKGDAFFRTGDLLRVSSEGHWYFADRLGDTFRWRSENVSTTEVAEKMGEVVREVNVYGVLVPGHDGRAGCAAIPLSTSGNVDLELLARHVQKTLPKYAQPLFVRLVKELESTGTSKQTKVALRNEGVDPAVVTSDPVFWLCPERGTYVRLTKGDWERIGAGKVKL